VPEKTADRLRALRQSNRKLRRAIKRQRKASRALTAPLTPKQLQKEMRAATRLRFGDEQREIDAQQRTSDVQQGRITDWFGKFKADTDAAIAAKNERDRLAQQAVLDRQNAAQTQDDAARQATQERMQADATARGMTVGSEPFKADLDAAAARRATTNTFGDLLAAQAQAQGAFLEDRERIASGSELQEHLDESARRRTLDQLERDLDAERGEFRIDYKRQARESERRNELEREAFGLEERKTEIDAALAAEAARSLTQDRREDNRRQRAQDRRAAMESDRQYRLDVLKFGAAQAKDRYQRRHEIGPYNRPDKDDDGLSPSERRQRRKDKRERREEADEAWSEVTTAAEVMGDLGQKPVAVRDETGEQIDTRPPTRDEVLRQMREDGFSQDQIIVALAIRHGDNIWDERTRAAARRLGIRIPERFLPKARNKSPRLQDRRGENAAS
jgi:hypothetical protein